MTTNHQGQAVRQKPVLLRAGTSTGSVHISPFVKGKARYAGFTPLPRDGQQISVSMFVITPGTTRNKPNQAQNGNK